MEDKDPTAVIKMIKDLRSGSEAYQRRSGISLRLSGAGVRTSSVFDSTDDSMSPPKRMKIDESPTSSLNLSNNSLPCSPWEWRRLKGENVSLRTRLSHQESVVEELHKIRKQMEEVFSSEKNLLQMQAERDKRTIEQLEARLDMEKRKMQEAKEAQSRTETELRRVKTKFEHKISSLMDENAKVHEELMNTTKKETPANSEKEFEADTSDLQLKLEAAEARVSQLEEKLKESQISQEKFELQSVQVQNLNIKIEKLESERALWEESKQLVNRAAKASDLEKELHAAKKTISVLRESVKGKLLLEEQMSNMMQRLEHIEKLEQQVAALESKRMDLSARLSEYESIGISGGPSALRREVHRMQQAEALLTSEEGRLRSELQAAQREIQNLKAKYEESKKHLVQETTSKETSNRILRRLQQKLMLITRERDSYRQQLDMYEKEMTTVESNNAVIERIPALERALEGYRELVAKLESDLRAAEGGTYKNECTKLREEIDKLKGELEHRALKGDFNCNARVLHFTNNPAAIAEQQAEEKQKAILQELELLRAQVASGNVTGAAGTSSVAAQEIAELKQTHEKKVDRLKEAFKVSSQEYRQACYKLFGWRVDRTKERVYKLFSLYAESPDDFLVFNVGEEGVELLETAFSATLGTLIVRYLQQQDSVPMFLNAVQADLYSQQTERISIN